MALCLGMSACAAEWTTANVGNEWQAAFPRQPQALKVTWPAGGQVHQLTSFLLMPKDDLLSSLVDDVVCAAGAGPLSPAALEEETLKRSMSEFAHMWARPAGLRVERSEFAALGSGTYELRATLEGSRILRVKVLSRRPDHIAFAIALYGQQKYVPRRSRSASSSHSARSSSMPVRRREIGRKHSARAQGAKAAGHAL